MKNFFCIALLTLTVFTQVAQAAAVSGVGVRVKYSTTPIGTSSWVPVITSSARLNSRGISILNTGVSVMELGIAVGGSSADTEVRQALIPSRFVGPGPGVAYDAMVMPLVIAPGSRISIRALDSGAGAGELQLNLFY